MIHGKKDYIEEIIKTRRQPIVMDYGFSFSFSIIYQRQTIEDD